MLLLLAIFYTYPLLVDVVGLSNNPTTASDSVDRKLWMTKIGEIDENLIAVEVFIVKDEEVDSGCRTKRRDDLRYSDKRYLMCAGSILTGRYILTSASCIHEAMYIRHNIKASLAAMIAPFSESAQVIKILDYSIHPDHVVDPRDESHDLHNVAIIKLACRISNKNLKQIKLPDQNFADLCAEESCITSIIKRISTISYTMQEMKAKDIPQPSRRKRRQIVITDEIKNSDEKVNKVSFVTGKLKKVSETDKNQLAIPVSTVLEKTIKENLRSLDKKYPKFARSIDQNIVGSSDDPYKKSFTEYNKRFKKLSTRASDEPSGCTETGTPVMSENVQSALVSMSCDMRQPYVPWRYTDLYDNLDFIKNILNSPNNRTTGGLEGGCSTCIYNFFIGEPLRKQPDRYYPPDCQHLPDKNRPDCYPSRLNYQRPPGHHSHSHRFPPNSPSGSRYSGRYPDDAKQAYFEAINDMYLNKKYQGIEYEENGNNTLVAIPSVKTIDALEHSLEKESLPRNFSESSKSKDEKYNPEIDFGDNLSNKNGPNHELNTSHYSYDIMALVDEKFHDPEAVYAALYKTFLDEYKRKRET